MAVTKLTAADAIQVDGLAESIRGLKKAADDLPRIVTGTVRRLTKEIMLPAARGRWASQPIRPSQATSAITASATQRAAGLKLRASVHPYAYGVEFGSKRFRQFRPWRGNRFTVAAGSATGYVVQDAIRDNLARFEERWEGEVVDAIRRRVLA